MGEIAEMMLDGTMCAGCGEWLHDGEDGPGYPEYCASCRKQGYADHEAEHECPTCSKLFGSDYAMNQHRRDAHKDGPQAGEPCPYCKNAKKRTPQGLADHIKAKHPEQST